MLVVEHPDGTLELVQNANITDPNLSGTLNEQSSTMQWSREFHPGEIAHVYVDFLTTQPTPGSGYCYNYTGAASANSGVVSNAFNYAGLVIGPE